MSKPIQLDPQIQIQSLATQVAQKAVVIAQLEALVAHLQDENENLRLDFATQASDPILAQGVE